MPTRENVICTGVPCRIILPVCHSFQPAAAHAGNPDREDGDFCLLALLLCNWETGRHLFEERHPLRYTRRRTPPQEEDTMANQEQLDLLKQGREVWRCLLSPACIPHTPRSFTYGAARGHSNVNGLQRQVAEHCVKREPRRLIAK